jgi:hypothetical protein
MKSKIIFSIATESARRAELQLADGALGKRLLAPKKGCSARALNCGIATLATTFMDHRRTADAPRNRQWRALHSPWQISDL